MIKPNRFKTAMKAACGCNQFKYTSIQSVDNLPQEKDLCFIDLSDWIKGKLPKGWSSINDEWDSLSVEIEDILDKNPGEKHSRWRSR